MPLFVSATVMTLGNASYLPSATNVHSANTNGRHGAAVTYAVHMLLFAEWYLLGTRQSVVLPSASALGKGLVC